MAEDEIIGWHHWLNGHEYKQASGDGERQGSQACCSPRSCKELDTTEQLKNNSKIKKGTAAVLKTLKSWAPSWRDIPEKIERDEINNR